MLLFILIFTASTVASKESSKTRLHCHALQLNDFCLDHNVQLTCVNIPWNLNCFADELSKIVVNEDYSVNCECVGKFQADSKYQLIDSLITLIQK